MFKRGGWGRGLPTSCDPPAEGRPAKEYGRRSPRGIAPQSMLNFLYRLVVTIVLTPAIPHYIGAEQYGMTR